MANSNPSQMKSLSFDSRIYEENKKKDDNIGIKSFSFASRAPSSELIYDDNNDKPFTIHEGDEEEGTHECTLEQLSDDVHQFSISLSSASTNGDPIEVSNVVEKFLKKLESKIAEYESTPQDSMVFGHDVDEDASFINVVNRLSGLMEALQGVKSNYLMPLMNQVGILHHRAMVFLEDELRLALEKAASQVTNNAGDSSNSKHSESSLNKLKGRLQSFASHSHDDGSDFCELPPGEDAAGGGGGGGESGDVGTEQEEQNEEKEPLTFPFISSDFVSSIRLIANAMITAGYEVECCNVFIITRRHVFEDELKKQGLEKISTDDVQKMNWEPLEGEISTWIRVFKYVTTTLLPGEQTFYESIFSDPLSTGQILYTDLSYAIISLLVSFAEAVSLTKRSTEKLFKILDMFETIRDTLPWIESRKTMYFSEESMKELKSELSFAKTRLGEAGVAIFCEIENSIKGDNNKTPVASGAVHPITRYIMNYLNIACEYKDTLEQIFQQHQNIEKTEEFGAVGSSSNPQGAAEDHHHPGQGQQNTHSPFSTQLINIMELLDSYLESKSKLYKDISLRYIFLMNNGRYMLQKVKGSSELHQAVGDTWYRKRSSDVRQYHKSYQRETWSKVLQCLNQEGLQVNGKVHKPILKERFKNFNQLFDEIHKTQSTWVVSDEQLQSELRVSISSVMIPAYRSFLARFGTIFTPGRQVEKYIKFQPDDIENIIEELFDGNPSSIARRKS